MAELLIFEISQKLSFVSETNLSFPSYFEFLQFFRKSQLLGQFSFYEQITTKHNFLSSNVSIKLIKNTTWQ